MKRRNPIRIGAAITSAALAIGAVGSWISLVNAREHGDYTALPGLGFLVLGLAVGSILCLAIPVVHQIEMRDADSARNKVRSYSLKDDYVAEYSFQNKIAAGTLVVFWVSLTLFMFIRMHRTIGSLIPLTLSVGSIWYAVHVASTSIRFTSERIIARLPGFRTVSAPYASIQKLQSKPRTIRVQFSDGRSLSVHSGLGDPNVVISYLQTYCPKSVYPEDSVHGQWPGRPPN